MNDLWSSPPLGSTAPIGELLLADTAIRIELPPSQHQLAVQRYEAVRGHIERQGSPLFDKVRMFYPQGSMAIGATIKSRKRSDGFDIDIIAELILPPSIPPAQVLDLLFSAIKGSPGSIYHDMAERQTRCVTVYYADGMHLDVTPTVLVNTLDPRLSHLFHAKPEEHPASHKRLLMNSFGFCEWFKARTPVDLAFAAAYAKRAADFSRSTMRLDADVVPVPAHSTVEGGKSATVVALQLLKRNRNLRYNKRKGMRLPPSVMLAKVAAETAVPGASIAGALDAMIRALQSLLETAERENCLVNITNPRCSEERFTDRWPEDRAAQRLFIGDLKLLQQQLAALMSEKLRLDQKRDILVEMFGEGPAQSAVDEFAAQHGQSVKSGHRIVAGTGRVIPVVAGAVPASASSAPKPRPHTFYSDRRFKR